MKILKFIRWQWNKFNTAIKYLVVFLSFEIAFMVTWYTLGAYAAVILLVSGGFFVITCIIIPALFAAIKQQWNNYNKEVEQERDTIVNRLRGVVDQ